MTRPPEMPREIPDLLESLRRHVKLLREFSVRAFQAGDYDYLGEVAGKLRLLVYEGGNNTPLLLALMDEFELDLPVTLGGPPIKPLPGQPGPGDQVSHRNYLALPAFGIRTPSKGFVQLTKKELIRTWAVKQGAAHEDWDLPEEFAAARDSGLFIGGLPALAAELRVTTETVLYVADKFLSILTPSLIALKAAEGRLKRAPNSVPARHARGVALAQLRRYEEALDEFMEVTKADPMHVRAHNNVGLALYHLGRFPEAVEAYRHAIGLDENYADPHYNLACVYSLEGNFSKCLEELERVKLLDGFGGKIDPVSDRTSQAYATIRNMAHGSWRWLGDKGVVLDTRRAWGCKFS